MMEQQKEMVKLTGRCFSQCNPGRPGTSLGSEILIFWNENVNIDENVNFLEDILTITIIIDS
jgi:hypothetical protein